MKRLSLLLLALAACQHAAPRTPAPETELFLRTSPPPAEPALFRPELMDAYGIRKNPVFTRDGRQLFWSVDRSQFRSVLMTARLQDGRWTQPEPLPFSRGDAFDHNPAISADGRTLVFASNRPIEGKQATTLPGTPVPTSDLFVSHRSGDRWSEPEPLPAAFNSTADDDSPVLAADGTLYFSSARPGAPGPGGIYMAAKRGGSWRDPVLLPGVNTAAGEMVTGVAADGSYIVFYSMREGDAAGLYISFGGPNNVWSTPVRLPQAVNARQAYAANVTPDGQALIFTARVDRVPRIYIMDALPLSALNRVALTRTRVDTIRYQLGGEALKTFTPAWDATVERGECIGVEPVSPGLTRLIAHFPDRANPLTSIRVLTDSTGRVFDYAEERGVPRPSRTVEEFEAQRRAMPRTSIQLQFDRNRASITNFLADRPPLGVMTSVDEMLASNLLGSFNDRVALVRGACNRH